MKKFKVREILNRVKDTLVIEDGQEYKRLTIRMYHKGVCLRDIELGENIGTKNQYVARSGQFIMSRIDARNGAFGIIPESIEHAAITNDFISFTVNEELMDIDFFELYSQTDSFMQLCIEGSKGTTNRKRLKEEVFLEFEVYLPEVERQTQIVNQVKKLQILKETLDTELYFQNKAIQNLRQSILLEAVQGKLVPQESKDEPTSVLLKKIQAQKELLTKAKKFKKEKPLSPITDEEISYELPKYWEWVRFQDVTINRDGERVPVSKEEREKREKIYDYYGASGVIDKIDSYLFDKPLLLIGEDGANLINRSTPIAFIAKGQYWVNNHAHVIDSTNQNILRYLEIYINSINLEAYVTGTAQPKMNQAKLNSIVVPFPPLNEQIRIVDKVDQLMALCDELEKTVNQSKQESVMLIQAKLQDAFSKPDRVNNIVEFPTLVSYDAEEEWDMIARAEGVSIETQAEIADTLEEIKRERR
ncbi:EcoKI restriction-modification system protein HsdS [compost metagenome]